MSQLYPIPDHLATELNILFVGFNPSIRSSETGHHYANPRNRFWTILEQAGITDRRYQADEDQDLLQHGIGFTNIVARPTKTAAEITPAEYAEGREQLLKKIQHYRPRCVCFVGKGVYEAYRNKKDTDWGVQPTSLVEGVREFVAPSSSGLVRMKLGEIVDIYKMLAKYIQMMV